MATPSAPTLQPDSPLGEVAPLALFSIGVISVAAFLLIAIVAVGRSAGRRAAIYRSLGLVLVGMIPFFYVVIPRVSDPLYLEQVVTAWDPAVVIQSLAYDILGLGLSIGLILIAIVSYIPQIDMYMSKEKNTEKKTTDENGASDAAGNPDSAIMSVTADIYKSKSPYIPPHAVFLVFGFGLMVFMAVCQQKWPKTLAYASALGALGIVVVIVYVFVLVSKLLSNTNDKSLSMAKANSAFAITSVAIAVIGLVIAVGLSPAMATSEPTFNIYNSYIILIVVFTCSGLLLFISMLYNDVWNAVRTIINTKRTNSNKGSKGR